MTRTALLRGMLLLPLAAVLACGPAPTKPQEDQMPDDVRSLITEEEDQGPGVNVSVETPEVAEEKVPGRTRYNRALGYFRAGDYRAAVREVEKCVAEYPKFVDAWYLLGTSHQGLGEHEQAVESLRKAVEVDPEYVRGYYALSQSLAALERFDEALEAIDKAQKLQPSPRFQRERARLLALKGDTEGAVKEYEALVKADPDDVETRRMLADNLLALDKTKEALGAYEELLQKTPDDDHALFNYGLALEKEGKMEQAIAQYKKAVAINDKNAEAYLNLGVAYVKQDERYPAIDALESYLRLKPDGSEAERVRDQIAMLRSGGTSS